jgi:hypothetical protein
MSDVLTVSLYFNQKATIANIKDIVLAFKDIDGNPINYTFTDYLISEYSM